MEGDGGRWAGLFYEGAEGGVPVPGVSGLAEVVEAGDADEDDGGRFGVGEGGEAVIEHPGSLQCNGFTSQAELDASLYGVAFAGNDGHLSSGA